MHQQLRPATQFEILLARALRAGVETLTVQIGRVPVTGTYLVTVSDGGVAPAQYAVLGNMLVPAHEDLSVLDPYAPASPADGLPSPSLASSPSRPPGKIRQTTE